MVSSRTIPNLKKSRYRPYAPDSYLLVEQSQNVTRRFISRPPKKEAISRKQEKTRQTLSENIFIVHGRDTKPALELSRILETLNLNPVILAEQPSMGRTLVEKLEIYSDVGYAFVILTPDDVGRLTTDEQNLRQRARQNVVLEFGYFMGMLGRDRVCCLYKGDVELPSDMHGIVYIPFRGSVEEAFYKIVKELKAVGYDVSIQRGSGVVKTSDMGWSEDMAKNLDPNLSHVYAVFFYPTDVSWEKGERNPKKIMPRFKAIVNSRKNEAYWMAEYAIDLFRKGRIQYVTASGASEQEMNEYFQSKEIQIIGRPATESDLLDTEKS